MLRLPGTNFELGAVMLPRRRTSAENAWLHGYQSVRLIRPLQALRVHARAGFAASFRPALAWGGSRVGRWFAIGDVILSRQEFADRHALPASFSHQDDWLLLPNCELNVGVAGPLFGHAGGALQAEWLSGPEPSSRSIHGFWSDRYGQA